MSEEIQAGDLWVSVDCPSRKSHHGPPAGLCLVIGPNHAGRVESPGSFVMMRLEAGARPSQRVGQRLYMHRQAREAGAWVRHTALTPRTP